MVYAEKLQLTWKFFSDQPFFAKNRTTTSESNSSIAPSTHDVISSNAASLVFQFESVKSFCIEGGIKSAMSASASSGLCLYLNVSSVPGGGGGGAFPFEAAAAGVGFLAAGAAAGVAAAGVAASAGFFA